MEPTTNPSPAAILNPPVTAENVLPPNPTPQQEGSTQAGLEAALNRETGAAEIKTPVTPKTEEVRVAVPPAVALSATVTLSHRSALIAKKRHAGLTKAQAEAAADAQIAHDNRLKQTPANAPALTSGSITERQKDVMIRELLDVPLSVTDDEVKTAFARAARYFDRASTLAQITRR